MIRLPIRLSKKYQVNQVNHEVAKKHHKHSTYNKPNILILIKIPCKYLVIIIPFPKVIPPCNYLVNHLFLLIYPQTTRMAILMMMSMCTGIPIKNYLLRKKNLTPTSKEIAVKIYSSISLNGAFV